MILAVKYLRSNIMSCKNHFKDFINKRIKQKQINGKDEKNQKQVKIYLITEDIINIVWQISEERI